MRCSNCNVDLSESSHVCPLCGQAAVDEEAVLSDLHEAPYPNYEEAEPMPKLRRKPNVHFLRIVLLFSAFCALIGSRPLWTVIAPVCLITASVFYFCYAFKEKSTLMHCAVALLVHIICQFLFFLFAMAQHFSLSGILFSMLLTILLLLILYFKFPERIEDQFDATFNL